MTFAKKKKKKTCDDQAKTPMHSDESGLGQLQENIHSPFVYQLKK